MRNLGLASLVTVALALSLAPLAPAWADGPPAADTPAAPAVGATAPAPAAAPRTPDEVRKDIRAMSTRLSTARQKLAETDPEMKALAAEVDALDKKRADLLAKEDERAVAASPDYKAMREKADALQKELAAITPPKKAAGAHPAAHPANGDHAADMPVNKPVPAP